MLIKAFSFTVNHNQAVFAPDFLSGWQTCFFYPKGIEKDKQLPCVFLVHLYKNGELGMVVSVPNNIDFCISNQKLEDCPHSLHQAEEQRLSRQFPDMNGEELHCVRGRKSPEPRNTE